MPGVCKDANSWYMRYVTFLFLLCVLMFPVPICFCLVTLTPFVLPLTFQPTYKPHVMYVSSVCISTSNCSLPHIWLKFLSLLLLVSLSRKYPQPSNLCLSTSSMFGNYFCSTLWFYAIWKPPRSTQYLPVSEIPDHDRRMAQCMNWSHCPDPLLHLETYETWPLCQVA